MTGRVISDIVVVGAGPAGAMAARYAAQGGRSVSLLERKANVGLPVRCGEGLGVKGLSHSGNYPDKWIKNRISKIRMISPSGIRVDLPNNDEGFILDRTVMDADLVKSAVHAGAAYFNNTPIISVENKNNRFICQSADGREFESLCIICADGVESRCARLLGWNACLSPRDVSTCAFCRISNSAIEADTCIFYLGREVAPGGYAWIFPRGDGSANVGVGIIGSLSSAGAAKEHLVRFVNSHFPGSAMADLHCGGVPVGHWQRPLVRGGAMIVGDAACQVNCLSGGGISYSLYAGKTAGSVAAEAFPGGSFSPKRLLRYEKQWASRFGNQQARTYSLKKMAISFHDDFLDEVARSLNARDPSKPKHLGQVWLRAFSHHPWLMFKAILLYRS